MRHQRSEDELEPSLLRGAPSNAPPGHGLGQGLMDVPLDPVKCQSSLGYERRVFVCQPWQCSIAWEGAQVDKRVRVFVVPCYLLKVLAQPVSAQVSLALEVSGRVLDPLVVDADQPLVWKVFAHQLADGKRVVLIFTQAPGEEWWWVISPLLVGTPGHVLLAEQLLGVRSQAVRITTLTPGQDVKRVSAREPLAHVTDHAFKSFRQRGVSQPS
jgi:hypothetical protein